LGLTSPSFFFIFDIPLLLHWDDRCTFFVALFFLLLRSRNFSWGLISSVFSCPSPPFLPLHSFYRIPRFDAVLSLRCAEPLGLEASRGPRLCFPPGFCLSAAFSTSTVRAVLLPALPPPPPKKKTQTKKKNPQNPHPPPPNPPPTNPLPKKQKTTPPPPPPPPKKKKQNKKNGFRGFF